MSKPLPRKLCREIYLIAPSEYNNPEAGHWELISNDHPAATLASPGLIVAGWTKPKPLNPVVDRRVLRQRNGRVPRLTTKVPR